MRLLGNTKETGRAGVLSTEKLFPCCFEYTEKNLNEKKKKKKAKRRKESEKRFSIKSLKRGVGGEAEMN